MSEPPSATVDDPVDVRAPWSVGLALLTIPLGILGAVVGAAMASAAVGDGVGTLSLAATAGSLVGLWSVYLVVMAKQLPRTDSWARRSWGAALGLRFRLIDLPLGVVAGLVSSIAIVQIVYLVLEVAKVVDETDLDRLDEPARELGDTARGPAFLILALLIGVGAPLIEELFFRGFLQRAVVGRLGAVGGVVVTAAIFGAVHMQPLQFPALFAFGLVLGALAHRTGRLGPAIVAHMVFNGLTLVALALAQSSPG